VDGLDVLKSVDCRSISIGSAMNTEDSILHAISRLESELDHDFIMKWTNALDFDSYMHNWLSLSTTGKSDDPSTFEFDLDEALDSVKMPDLKSNDKNVAEDNAMMAEIDLFRKIAAETSNALYPNDLPPLPYSPSVALTDETSKSRPTSGRSLKSVKDLFLTPISPLPSS
jgi:hypothetical protein